MVRMPPRPRPGPRRAPGVYDRRVGVPGRWAATVLAAVALVAGCTPYGAPPASGIRDAVEAHRRPALGGAPLASWTYRVLAVRQDGRRASVDAELTYALDGYDRAPATARRRLDLAERDGRWRVTGDRPAQGRPAQLWDHGPVRAVRGARSLVLGVGHPRRGSARSPRPPTAPSPP